MKYIYIQNFETSLVILKWSQLLYEFNFHLFNYWDMKRAVRFLFANCMLRLVHSPLLTYHYSCNRCIQRYWVVAHNNKVLHNSLKLWIFMKTWSVCIINMLAWKWMQIFLRTNLWTSWTNSIVEVKLIRWDQTETRSKELLISKCIYRI